MNSVPSDRGIDHTLALLREGYQFIQRRCRRLETDIFRTRLLGESVLCMTGSEAAELFYDGDRFQRAGALPRRIQKTLMGAHGVQTLDDAAHRHRKAMFMSLTTPERVIGLAARTGEMWRGALSGWMRASEVVLFPETQDILCRAVCAWAGVPLTESEVRRRASDFGAMVDAFGAIGPRHWRGRWARRRAERWISGLIGDVRIGRVQPDPDTALAVVARHRELDGAPLDEELAAVELLNLLRPTVAIATYVVFAALALHEHPDHRRRIHDEGETYAEMFAQEVRRFYPFAPFIGARVRKDFEWRGVKFEEGTLVLLDLYGINHDARLWDHPDDFRPERFAGQDIGPFEFVPHGGGAVEAGHRCAGEQITLRTLTVAVRFLASEVEYDVPAQDLGYSLARVPTLPRSGFVMRRIRATATEIAGRASWPQAVGTSPPGS